MKASKFSDAQKAFTLKQGLEGAPVSGKPLTDYRRRPVGLVKKPAYSAII